MSGRSGRPPTGFAGRRWRDRSHRGISRVSVSVTSMRRARRRLAGAHPVVQPGDRGLQDVMVLGGEVDEVRQLLTHQFVGRRVGRDDLIQRYRSVVDEPHPDRVVVGVRRAGNLPDPEVLGIRHAGVDIAEQPRAEQVGFGDHGEHRCPQIGTERHRQCVEITGFVEQGRAVQRRGRPEPGVDQEAVIDAGGRIDLVDVGGQERGRLRLPPASTNCGARPSITPARTARPTWVKIS